MGDLPRRMLLAKVRDSRIILPVGDGLTFVAPSSGDLSFRVNNETEATGAFNGDLRVTLEHIHRPRFVDSSGKTTISTRVCKTKYLLFEPEGIRWQFSSTQSALEEPEYPTLLNGIAWWPLPDKTNTEGWREFTVTSRTPLLRTRAFAWAAEPNGTTPTITSKTSAETSVIAEGPAPNHPGLTFAGPSDYAAAVDCQVYPAP